MLVSRKNFKEVIALLSKTGRYSFDTETTGLRPWQEDRLFSLIIADAETTYYFNFQNYPGLNPEHLFKKSELKKLRPIFANPESFWYAHNAKFDMAMLAVEGVEIAGEVHCTMAQGRVLQNNLFNYGLDALVKPLGFAKSKAVEEHIKKFKLYTMEDGPEPGEEIRVPHYDQVPFDIMSQYGQTDALVTRALGELQVEGLTSKNAAMPPNRESVLNIMANERKLTKTFFEMERRGIKVDKAYCDLASNYEQKRVLDAKRKFRELTGIEFVDSNKTLSEAFTKLGIYYPRTEKGNPSFTAEVLDGVENPVARLIREYRDASKRRNTYYQNFIKFSDDDDVLHANARQGGTKTGRVSYSEPNLQNLNKEEGEELKAEFVVRRAFIPRPGFLFTMIDYKQMEYRLMLEYARETSLIALVNDGMDIHEATAQLMSTPERKIARQPAKTINFMLLYGGGVAKLAMALFPVTLPERELKLIQRARIWGKLDAAKELAPLAIDEQVIAFNLEQLHKATALRELYFTKLPQVKKFSQNVIEMAEKRGYLINWAGRVCHFHPAAAYTAPNHLIQGGCADVIKFAMPRLEVFLRQFQSKMLVQIHDELLFEIHESETHIVPELRSIMESSYKHQLVPLLCDVDHSRKSWADKTKGVPGDGP